MQLMRAQDETNYNYEWQILQFVSMGSLPVKGRYTTADRWCHKLRQGSQENTRMRYHEGTLKNAQCQTPCYHKSTTEIARTHWLQIHLCLTRNINPQPVTSLGTAAPAPAQRILTKLSTKG